MHKDVTSRRVAKPERRGEPLEGPGVPGYDTGRAVADTPAEKKSLQGGVKVRFGVSICFLRLLGKAKSLGALI
jgi:hypothetical protein